jgi:CRP-like cAMP-binding protein
MGAKSSGKNLAINKDRVGRFAIFRELTSQQIDELFVWIHRRDYSPGEILIKEGRQAMGLFILIGGTVSVVKSSKFGKVKLTEISAPSILGEVGLLSGIPRTARVRAQTRVIAGYIPALLFKNKLAENNITALRLCLNMSRILCKRLSETSELLCSAGLYFAKHAGR